MHYLNLILDGRNHLLTPEKSIEIQRDIGADLILVFDECTPFHVDKTYIQLNQCYRSHRWAKTICKLVLKVKKL